MSRLSENNTEDINQGRPKLKMGQKYLSKKDILHLKRDSSSHKGDNGRILVIGGSEDYTGAVYLAAKSAAEAVQALAALRAGADLVRVAAPEKVAWAINSMSPDLITVKMKGKYLGLKHYKALQKLVDGCDVLLTGNGLSLNNSTKQLAAKLIENNPGKLKVIDADAIKAIRLQEVENAIFTPHKGEFSVLLKNSGLNEDNLQRKLGSNVVLVKGSVDRIISQKNIALNKTGNPGMTVGGTGDVLAGLCAGYLAQSKDLFKSACTAAYVNGSVGDRLYKKYGNGLIASDFLGEIAEVGHELGINLKKL
jgi:ADP-dependent NAD(P)H-hydrate dehydratase / NAD(P)H-hydrate epimerase